MDISKKTVVIGKGEYGYPEPQIIVELVRGSNSQRAVNAAMHEIAAKVELATPDSEAWIVQVDNASFSARVKLELHSATEAEASRGLALLQKVADTL